MTIEEEFTKWFDEQVENGLVDFKLDVRGAADGTTREAVMAEILLIEKMIAAGEVEEHLPMQTSECHPVADEIICRNLASAYSFSKPGIPCSPAAKQMFIPR